MADHVILRPLDGSDNARRILDEFEPAPTCMPSRTATAAVRAARRRAPDAHRPTLNEINGAWTDHVGLRFPE